MTIIVFVVDTSPSMYQTAYNMGNRSTILDFAKTTVETFVRVRQRIPESRVDRYMLLTFDEPPINLKAGWKENISTFMNELKNLQGTGCLSTGTALRFTFDVLNVNRMQIGIDTYGQGRFPYFVEPAFIVLITDGTLKTSDETSIIANFHSSKRGMVPGSELTKEVYRWDQRLFALVLKLPGTPPPERDSTLVPNDSSQIESICEATGGRSYCVTSHQILLQCIESLVQKIHTGVVINFERSAIEISSVELDKNKENVKSINGSQSSESNDHKHGAKLNSWHSCRKLIYVPKFNQKGFTEGFWPIPESFWPDGKISMLPSRSAHPKVVFSCTDQIPVIIENMPFDKYELEPSPLTQHILSRKQASTCWQVFIPNSGNTRNIEHPFGYLKASTQLTSVSLFIMPYNYPVLLSLLDELLKTYHMNPNGDWCSRFQNYIQMMPPYYATPLKRALRKIGVPSSLLSLWIPKSLDNYLNYTVLNYLRKLKLDAKIEFDRMCYNVINSHNYCNTSNVNKIKIASFVSLKTNFITHPNMMESVKVLKEKSTDRYLSISKRPIDFFNTKSYRNPYDIYRSNIIDQTIRMRSNIVRVNKKLFDEDTIHSIPINQMGNYQEFLKNGPKPLRELESTSDRKYIFGNPFKNDTKIMVDEADVEIDYYSKSHKNIKKYGPVCNKRKPGPLPKNFLAKKQFSQTKT